MNFLSGYDGDTQRVGKLADRTSIGFVFELCAYLPLLGLLTALLPDTRRR